MPNLAFESYKNNSAYSFSWFTFLPVCIMINDNYDLFLSFYVDKLLVDEIICAPKIILNTRIYDLKKLV